MIDRDELLQRVDELEAHVAHQDGAIEDLNDVVLRQWKEIEALREQIVRLNNRLEGLIEAGESDSGPEPPPPHY